MVPVDVGNNGDVKNLILAHTKKRGMFVVVRD